MADACRQKDLSASVATWHCFWGIPVVAMVVGSFLQSPVSNFVWSGALLWAGAACIFNACRCRRIHCYLTGPLFVVAAAAILLAGFDVVSLPTRWILLAVFGGTAFAFVLEFALGTKYAGHTTES